MGGKFKSAGRILYDSVKDFIFPKICIVRDEKLPENNSNDFLDDRVIQSLERLNVNDIIGMKLKISNKEIFSLYSFRANSEMQKIIHNFKYNGFQNVGLIFGNILADELLNSNLDISSYDMIAPVPLFIAKERSRGYNQSSILASVIGKKVGVDFIPDLLIRTKDTKSQTGMNKDERVANVKNVFRLNDSYEIRGKKIILVDDVMTTGSTVSECLKILKKKGGEKVLAVSLAIAK
jgi:ComF family protein